MSQKPSEKGIWFLFTDCGLESWNNFAGSYSWGLSGLSSTEFIPFFNCRKPGCLLQQQREKTRKAGEWSRVGQYMECAQKILWMIRHLTRGLVLMVSPGEPDVTCQAWRREDRVWVRAWSQNLIVSFVDCHLARWTLSFPINYAIDYGKASNIQLYLCTALWTWAVWGQGMDLSLYLRYLENAC